MQVCCTPLGEEKFGGSLARMAARTGYGDEGFWFWFWVLWGEERKKESTGEWWYTFWESAGFNIVEIWMYMLSLCEYGIEALHFFFRTDLFACLSFAPVFASFKALGLIQDLC